MDDTTASDVRITALREAYASLNRGDVAGFVAPFDAQVERVEPAGFPRAGTYRGREAVREHVTEGRGTWAEGTCEPQRFIIAGDRVVVLAHVHVRLKDATDWIDGDIGDVFTFRDGKVIEYRTFGDAQEAFDWAGAVSG